MDGVLAIRSRDTTQQARWSARRPAGYIARESHPTAIPQMRVVLGHRRGLRDAAASGGHRTPVSLAADLAPSDQANAAAWRSAISCRAHPAWGARRAIAVPALARSFVAVGPADAKRRASELYPPAAHTVASAAPLARAGPIGQSQRAVPAGEKAVRGRPSADPISVDWERHTPQVDVLSALPSKAQDARKADARERWKPACPAGARSDARSFSRFRQVVG